MAYAFEPIGRKTLNIKLNRSSERLKSFPHATKTIRRKKMEEMTKDFLKEANKKGAVSKEDLKLLEDFMDSKPLK